MIHNKAIGSNPKVKPSAFRKHEKYIHNELKKRKTSIHNPTNEWNLFEGKELSKTIVSNANFEKITKYMMKVGEIAHLHKAQELFSPFVADELIYWDRKGSFCMYISILAYNLYLHYNVFTPNQLKYIQGYFFHKTNINNSIVNLNIQEHMGIHAWLVVNGGSVLDFSINQEYMFFDFNQPWGAFFLGPVSEGMYLKGGVESEKVVKKWTATFAERTNLTTKEWLDKHIDVIDA